MSTINRVRLRETIERTPDGAPAAAMVTREWLEDLERELSELDERRAADTPCEEATS